MFLHMPESSECYKVDNKEISIPFECPGLKKGKPQMEEAPVQKSVEGKR